MSIAIAERLSPEAERKVRIAQEQLKVALEGMQVMEGHAAALGREVERTSERFRMLHGLVVRLATGQCTGRRMPDHDCRFYPEDIPGCITCECRRALERMPR